MKIIKSASLLTVVVACLIVSPFAVAQESLFTLSSPIKSVASKSEVKAAKLAAENSLSSSQEKPLVSFQAQLTDKQLSGDAYYMDLLGKRVLVNRMNLSNPQQVKTDGLQTQQSRTDKSMEVFYFVESRGSVTFDKVAGQVSSARLYDADAQRTFKGVVDQNGNIEFVEEDINKYICINYANADSVVSEPSISQANPDIIANSRNVTLAQVQTLQSRPGSSRVVFIDYWGGVVSGTAWNANNGGNDINYLPFDKDGNSNNFNQNELELMYVAWAEAAEDYAPFDVNITTDINVFNAVPANQRSRMIATSTNTAAPGSGGVAYVGIFGENPGFGRNANFYSVGWTFNAGFTTMGMTHSHEAGHQMGLRHDGGAANPDYYSGHSNWGPIMGAPFGKDYVQWSKGDYNGANQTQNDLNIVKARLTEVADDAGDNNANATAINIDGTDLTGIISPAGLRADTDVYLLQQSVTSTVSIEVRSFAEGLRTGTGPNLSTRVQLRNSAGSLVAEQGPTNLPSSNKFIFNQPLAPGQYYLSVKNESPNTNPASGFDEYGNGGFYRVVVSGGIFNSGDNDNDNVQNHLDNCPDDPNTNQANNDDDALGDACDNDDDNDSRIDTADNCPFTSNSNQANFDNDTFGDVCDADIDNDGRLNPLDTNDFNKFICADTDSDSCNDCSSGAFNVAQDGVDTDANGICDLGDTDDDGDTVADIVDNCPLAHNTDQANFDNDQDGDACDNDIDNDGAPNGLDSNSNNARICSDNDNDQCDDCNSGTFDVTNDGLDTDQNGICNLGDPDDDGDTVVDEFDNCPVTPNEDQADGDNDGIGDACKDPDELCLPIPAGKGMVLICL